VEQSKDAGQEDRARQEAAHDPPQGRIHGSTWMCGDVLVPVSRLGGEFFEYP
jgi:hypothetical protein